MAKFTQSETDKLVECPGIWGLLNDALRVRMREFTLSAARKLATRWRLDEFKEDELWKLTDMPRGCEVPDAELDELILGLGTPVRGGASVVPPSSSNKMDARTAAATEAPVPCQPRRGRSCRT